MDLFKLILLIYKVCGTLLGTYDDARVKLENHCLRKVNYSNKGFLLAALTTALNKRKYEGLQSRGVVIGSIIGGELETMLSAYFILFRFFLVSRQSAALSSATQHAMPPESGRKWGTECLNTRFPLPTLPCAGYSMKLIYLT